MLFSKVVFKQLRCWCMYLSSFSSFWDLPTWVNVIWPRCSFYQFVLKPLLLTFDLELPIWFTHIKNAISVGISHSSHCCEKIIQHFLFVPTFLGWSFCISSICCTHPLADYLLLKSLRCFLVLVLTLLTDFCSKYFYNCLTIILFLTC